MKQRIGDRAVNWIGNLELESSGDGRIGSCLRAGISTGQCLRIVESTVHGCLTYCKNDFSSGYIPLSSPDRAPSYGEHR